MEKNPSKGKFPNLKYVFLSFFLVYFTIQLIIPYLSIDSFINYSHPNMVIVTIIFSIPAIAQVTTMYLFNWLAEVKGWVKSLILLGYITNVIQFIVLYYIHLYFRDAYLILVVTFLANLFAIAYIPAIKAFIAKANPQARATAVSKLSIIMTVCYGAGSLLGGFLYTWWNLDGMIILALICSITAVGMIGLIPSMNIQNLSDACNEKSSNQALNPKYSQKNDCSPHPSVFTFQQALWWQFGLRVVSSSFFGIFGLYLTSIGNEAWTYGVSSACAALFGSFALGFFGRWCDKRGPNRLYWYGWIAYTFVYLALLSTTSLIAIILIWAVPAYTYTLSTEYLATVQKDSRYAIRNMTKATMSHTLGVVIGQILGGIIMLFGTYHTVMWVAMIGSIIMGIILTFVTLKWRRKHLLSAK